MISDEDLTLMEKKFEAIDKKYPNGFLTEEEKEIKEVTDEFLKSRKNHQPKENINKEAQKLGMKTIYIDPVDGEDD